MRYVLRTSLDSRTLPLDERSCSRPFAGSGYPLLRISAGFGVGLKHFLDRTQLPGIRCCNRLFDDPGNFIECDAAIEKRGDGDLIGGVQRHRFRSTRLGCFVRQTETRKFTHVWWAEVQMTQVPDREAHIRLNAFGIG